MRHTWESSAIEATQYSYRTKTLRIWWNNGAVYRYTGVTLQQYGTLCRANSKGKHFSSKLRKTLTNYTKEPAGARV